jgi:hypothetical protein
MISGFLDFVYSRQRTKSRNLVILSVIHHRRNPLYSTFLYVFNNFEIFRDLLYFLQDSGVGTPVTLRVDQNGFYLYWVDQNKVCDFNFSVFVQGNSSLEARLWRQTYFCLDHTPSNWPDIESVC